MLDANRHEHFDREIMNEMGEMGFLGATLDGYGCAGVNYVSYGLIAREVERVDSGYRSAFSVQSSLVMYPIHAFGSDAQKEKMSAEAARRRVRRLLRPDRAGCRVRPRPRCARGPRAVDGGFVLNGSKTWITNSPIADVFVVWAKDDAGDIRGFILEKGMTGPDGAEDRGQIQPARRDHRHDHDAGRVRAGGACCPA